MSARKGNSSWFARPGSKNAGVERGSREWFAGAVWIEAHAGDHPRSQIAKRHFPGVTGLLLR
jgi:hypothetical protein